MPYPDALAAKARLDELLDGATYRPGRVPLLDEARHNFLAADPALMGQVERWLWVYYRAEYEKWDPDDRAEWGVPEIEDEAEIWSHVTFRTSPELCTPNGSAYEPHTSYLSFEGDVAWEPEHGLQLVFDHGLEVCKVGPYDGHHTNAHACADIDLLGEVFWN